MPEPIWRAYHFVVLALILGALTVLGQDETALCGNDTQLLSALQNSSVNLILLTRNITLQPSRYIVNAAQITRRLTIRPQSTSVLTLINVNFLTRGSVVCLRSTCDLTIRGRNLVFLNNYVDTLSDNDFNFIPTFLQFGQDGRIQALEYTVQLSKPNAFFSPSSSIFLPANAWWAGSPQVTCLSATSLYVERWVLDLNLRNQVIRPGDLSNYSGTLSMSFITLRLTVPLAPDSTECSEYAQLCQRFNTPLGSGACTAQQRSSRVPKWVPYVVGFVGGAVLLAVITIAVVLLLRRRQRYAAAMGAGSSISTSLPQLDMEAHGQGGAASCNPRGGVSTNGLQTTFSLAATQPHALSSVTTPSGVDTQLVAVKALVAGGEAQDSCNESSSNTNRRMSGSIIGKAVDALPVGVPANRDVSMRFAGGGLGGAGLGYGGGGGGMMLGNGMSMDSMFNDVALAAAGGGAGGGGGNARSRSLPLSFGNPLEVTIIEMIGKGAYGVVYRAVWQDQIVALKIIQQQRNELKQRNAYPTSGVGMATMTTTAGSAATASTAASESSLRQQVAINMLAVSAAAAAATTGSGGDAPGLPGQASVVPGVVGIGDLSLVPAEAVLGARLSHPHVLRTLAYAVVTPEPAGNSTAPGIVDSSSGIDTQLGNVLSSGAPGTARTLLPTLVSTGSTVAGPASVAGGINSATPTAGMSAAGLVPPSGGFVIRASSSAPTSMSTDNAAADGGSGAAGGGGGGGSGGAMLGHMGQATPAPLPPMLERVGGRPELADLSPGAPGSPSLRFGTTTTTITTTGATPVTTNTTQTQHTAGLPQTPSAAAAAAATAAVALPRSMVEVHLVLEYCDSGALKDWLATRGEELAAGVVTPVMHLRDVLVMCCEILSALAYLHAEGVVHGDLKCHNVMLTTRKQQQQQEAPLSQEQQQQGGVTAREVADSSCQGNGGADGSSGLHTKLADFGYSQQLRPDHSHTTLSRPGGTVSHIAPELLSTNRLAPACDMYAFGIMLSEVMSCKTAFSGKSVPQILYLKTLGRVEESLEWPPYTPPGMVSLAEACVRTDPTQRPTATEAYETLKTLQAEALVGA